MDHVVVVEVALPPLARVNLHRFAVIVVDQKLSSIGETQKKEQVAHMLYLYLYRLAVLIVHYKPSSIKKTNQRASRTLNRHFHRLVVLIADQELCSIGKGQRVSGVHCSRWAVAAERGRDRQRAAGASNGQG